MQRFNAVLLGSIWIGLCQTSFLDAAEMPEPGSKLRPSKSWTREGDLGQTPERLNDVFPLSDQKNECGWTRLDSMWDEFDGPQLDGERWNASPKWWKGRQPSLFDAKNVSVSDGKLHLTMRKEAEPFSPELEKQGYHGYTSALVFSTTPVTYGYFEVKAKPMDSGGSSSFWFARGSEPGKLRSEIDVFEIGAKAPGFEKKYNMNLHIFGDPSGEKDNHWSFGGVWLAPWPLGDDYHVYGVDWTEREIKYYVDGVLVRSVENTHWHQPLRLIFDSETMPEWFGMPDDKDLPSTFSVEYVRGWTRPGQ